MSKRKDNDFMDVDYDSDISMGDDDDFKVSKGKGKGKAVDKKKKEKGKGKPKDVVRIFFHTRQDRPSLSSSSKHTLGRQISRVHGTPFKKMRVAVFRER